MLGLSGLEGFIAENSDAAMERIWSWLPAESNGDALEDLAKWRTMTDLARQARLDDTDKPDAGSDHRQEARLESLGL